MYDEDRFMIKVVVLSLIGISILIGALMWVGCKEDRAYEESCRSRGGHVVVRTHTGTGIGFGAKGSVIPVTTTSVEQWCIGPQGQVLD